MRKIVLNELQIRELERVLEKVKGKHFSQIMQILGAGIVQPEQEQTLDDGNARPIGGSGGGGGNPRPQKP